MAKVSIEEAFAQLDAILGQLEGGELSLDDSLARYNEGVKLIKACNQQLDRVEKQIRILDTNEEE
jgi:exodeoxyribonuclease VII small subunit